MTGAKYLIEYRLDVPERAEWEDDWVTVSASVAKDDIAYSHTVSLEKYYPRGGTTPPFEWVPTAFKGLLALNDSDAGNDVILPFGIKVEYRVRAVNGTPKGRPARAGVRVPNPGGVPGVVTVHYHPVQACLVWTHATDADGNRPSGYRVRYDPQSGGGPSGVNRELAAQSTWRGIDDRSRKTCAGVGIAVVSGCLRRKIASGALRGDDECGKSNGNNDLHAVG